MNTANRVETTIAADLWPCQRMLNLINESNTDSSLYGGWIRRFMKGEGDTKEGVTGVGVLKQGLLEQGEKHEFEEPNNQERIEAQQKKWKKNKMTIKQRLTR